MLLEFKYSLLFQQVSSSALFYILSIKTRHFAYRSSLIPSYCVCLAALKLIGNRKLQVHALRVCNTVCHLTRQTLCGFILKSYMKISNFKSNAYVTFVEKSRPSIVSV